MTHNSSSTVPFDYCVIHGRGAMVQRFAQGSSSIFWWECPQCISANRSESVAQPIYQFSPPAPAAPRPTTGDTDTEYSRKFRESLRASDQAAASPVVGTPPTLENLLNEYEMAHWAFVDAEYADDDEAPSQWDSARKALDAARSALESLFLASQEEIARLRGYIEESDKERIDFATRLGAAEDANSTALDEHLRYVLRSEAELSRLRTSQLSQTEAWYLEEDVHIPHTPECTFWTEDKCDECTCISGRIREKIARIMSAVPQEKTYDP